MYPLVRGRSRACAGPRRPGRAAAATDARPSQDLIRRRFQLQSAPGNPLPPERRYKSVWDALTRIHREEGVKGWFKGFSANFVKTWPTIAVMFVTNDLMNDFFKRVGA